MEFIRPEIWPYDSPEYLALVSDEAKVDGSLARIRRDGTLEKMPHCIPDRYSGSYSYTRGYAADSQGRIAFVYRSGLYLYDGRDTSVVADSTVKKIADLRLKGQSAGSTMNIGSLGVNFKYQRMVWAPMSPATGNFIPGRNISTFCIPAGHLRMS